MVTYCPDFVDFVLMLVSKHLGLECLSKSRADLWACLCWCMLVFWSLVSVFLWFSGPCSLWLNIGFPAKLG